MASIIENLENIVYQAFEKSGYDASLGKITYSNRPDLCQFQCNGAMAAAKKYQKKPRDIASTILDTIKNESCFAKVEIAGPGFINLTLTDTYLTQFVTEMGNDTRLGCTQQKSDRPMIIDYGGANIAKPLHVGHLRSGIIGECLKRLARFVGYEVKGDVHLGDWGLQMGMVIYEIQCRQPDLPYFLDSFSGPFPQKSPVTVTDLEEIYPCIAQKAKNDEKVKEACRKATADLQKGHKGYMALWRHIFDISVKDLKEGYGQLQIDFDLWLGESDTRDIIPQLIQDLQEKKFAIESDGALIIEVAKEEDGHHQVPPLLLTKTDGAVLYGTTDLATIVQRVADDNPWLILYVVDRRQHIHFDQVFRAARKTGIAGEKLNLEHVGFGTMNGNDGKPFKTRAGGVMKLKDLISMVVEKAIERVRESHTESRGMSDDELTAIARMVGVATLKFADLNNHPGTDYIFDLERFSSFDGRTGPYQLYTVTRIKSILRKAESMNLSPSLLLPPQDEAERSLLLKLTELPQVIKLSFDRRSPNLLCEYCHGLGSTFNTFYHDHHILREPDHRRQGSWLSLSRITLNALVLILDILGIEVPERM